MKILAINGSHRNGNTQFMLQTMVSQLNADSEQNEAVLVNLREKNLQYSNQSDYSCSQTSNCPCCRDDMKQIYSMIETCNILILGSPVYFSNVSGRMKTLMDRCNPYYWNGKLKNKHVIMVGVGQSSANVEFFKDFTLFCETLGMKVIDSFYARAQGSDGVLKSQETVHALKQFSKKIVQVHTHNLKTL